jgi:hypothetical protein
LDKWLGKKFDGTISSDRSKNLLLWGGIISSLQGDVCDLVLGNKVANELLSRGIENVDKAVTVRGEECTYASGLGRRRNDSVDRVAHGGELNRFVGLLGIY